MGKRPNLKDVEVLFNAGKNFELTNAQYEKKTGAELPKDTYYLKNKSAIANMAREKGFEVTVVERKIVLTKKK